jgi:flagellar M-ring protein FliF
VVETTIQPDSRVTISSDSEEISDDASGAAGAVTVASNLPTGDADPSNRKSSRSETRERVNYDYSGVRRERTRAAGAIRRISVAVLVDGIAVQTASGAPEWQARPVEELAALRQLVEAAVGFDANRGDVVTVESMAFQPDATPGELVEGSPLLRFLERNALTLVQIGVLAVVALVLALAVVRPLLAGRRRADDFMTLDGTGTTIDLGGPVAASLPGPEGPQPPVERRADPEALRLAVAENQEQTLVMLKDWLGTADEEAA